jgi:hypothetical protein
MGGCWSPKQLMKGMKKTFFVILFSVVSVTFSFGQKYYSKTGHVHFLSEAPIETIQSDNQNAFVVLDGATGNFEFSVLIKGFKFVKALMQQHFNENYMESDQFPKSTYKGSVTNWPSVHLDKDGVYNVNTKGDLTIHGITKPFSSPAKLTVKGEVVSVYATLDIVIADFGIEVPKVVRDNISKTVKVTFNADLQRMK